MYLVAIQPHRQLNTVSPVISALILLDEHHLKHQPRISRLPAPRPASKKRPIRHLAHAPVRLAILVLNHNAVMSAVEIRRGVAQRELEPGMILRHEAVVLDDPRDCGAEVELRDIAALNLLAVGVEGDGEGVGSVACAAGGGADDGAWGDGVDA